MRLNQLTLLPHDVPSYFVLLCPTSIFSGRICVAIFVPVNVLKDQNAMIGESTFLDTTGESLNYKVYIYREDSHPEPCHWSSRMLSRKLHKKLLVRLGNVTHFWVEKVGLLQDQCNGNGSENIEKRKSPLENWKLDGNHEETEDIRIGFIWTTWVRRGKSKEQLPAVFRFDEFITLKLWRRKIELFVFCGGTSCLERESNQLPKNPWNI